MGLDSSSISSSSALSTEILFVLCPLCVSLLSSSVLNILDSSLQLGSSQYIRSFYCIPLGYFKFYYGDEIKIKIL